MIPYFPLHSDRFEMTMDAQAGVSSLIEVEADKYCAQVALKADIIAYDPRYYVQCLPDTDALAWETLETLLPNMAEHWPQHFTLHTQGARWTWTNKLLHTITVFTLNDTGTLPLSPLDWLARQVQEDLILMRQFEPDGETVCVAGHLCFGSAWCLDDKIGRSFLQIHDPVPGFREQVGTPSDLLMRRLKPHRPVSRVNWSLTSTDRLNLAPALAADWHKSRHEITQENAGQRVCFRVERQTLSRLPRTGAILFTIHTYINTLEEVIADADRLRRLAAVMRDYPENLKDYKGMHIYYDALMTYLEQRLATVENGD